MDKKIERAVALEVERFLSATRFACIDRSCRHSALHLKHKAQFVCTLKDVVHGVDNGGHWCDMYEEGKPAWCDDTSSLAQQARTEGSTDRA